MNFSNQKFICQRARETHGLDQNNANFEFSRLQGPVPAPSRMKDIQQAEFQAFPTVALISPFILC